MSRSDRGWRAPLFVVPLALASLANAGSLSCPQLQVRVPFGPTLVVEVAGDRAFVADGPTVLIAELGVGGPEVVGEIAVTDVVVGLAAEPSGHRIYAADAGGVTAIDVTDPADPTALGRREVAGTVSGLAVSGDLVLVTNEDHGLSILDFVEPGAPVELASLATPGVALDVAVAPPYAYVADFDWGLRVIDVSVPASPVVVTRFVPAGDSALYLGRVEIAEALGIATVWDEDGAWMVTIDLADPSAPREVGGHPLSSGLGGVAVSAPFVFVADDCRLRVFDISDPTTVVAASEWLLHGSVRSPVTEGRWLAAAEPSYGGAVFERSGDGGLTWRGRVPTTGGAAAIAVDRGRVYAAGSGLKILDASTPGRVAELGAWSDPDGIHEDIGWARAVAVADDHVFVVSNAGSVLVFDATVPEQPEVVAELPSLRAQDATVAEGLLVDVGDGLGVHDISLPDAPLSLAHVALPGATRVAVAGGHAFVTTDSTSELNGNALWVVDLATPTAPSLVATLTLPSRPSDVEVSGGTAFVGTLSSGVLAVDVSDPSQPAVVGRLEGPVEAGRMVVSDSCLYVLEGDHLGGGATRLRVVRVADPARMVSLAVTSTAGGASDLATSGGRVVLGEGSRGLSLLDVAHCGCRLALTASEPD